MRANVQPLPVQSSNDPQPPIKKPWWHVNISANDFKSKAVYDTVKFTLYTLITAFGGSKLFQTSLAKVPYAALTALGVFLIVRMLWPPKRKGEPSKTLVFSVLQQDCEALLNRYKPLMFDHRQESRLPLNPSSWPNFGEPFDYIHFSLASNSRMFSEFMPKMRSLWQDMQRTDDLKLFSLGEYSRMDEVVDALQEADQILKQFQSAR
jgi:hypothetical protein